MKTVCSFFGPLGIAIANVLKLTAVRPRREPPIGQAVPIGAWTYGPILRPEIGNDERKAKDTARNREDGLNCSRLQGGPKKLHTVFIEITLSTLNHFS